MKSFTTQSTTNETANAKGRIRFNSLNNFFEGNPQPGRTCFSETPSGTLYNQAFAGFLQDDWRVKPRLTVNLGVRYELNTVVHERDGLMGNFDPILGLVQTNNPYHGDHNNFAPRVGFAWDIAWRRQDRAPRGRRHPLRATQLRRDEWRRQPARPAHLPDRPSSFQRRQHDSRSR